MRQTKRLLSLVAAVLLIAACTDNGIFNPLADASGTYQLTVYAGKTPPAQYTIPPNDPDYPSLPNGATVVYTDGAMVLSSNGTFVETNYYTVTPTGGSPSNGTFVRTGTWTLVDTDLTLNIPAQNGSSALTDSGTLTTDGNGRYTINYQEANSAGGFDAYEYKR
jgi:hypothetical protein